MARIRNQEETENDAQEASEDLPQAINSEQGEGTQAFAQFATQAIAQGIQNLNLDPHFLEWGQRTVEASVAMIDPIRRSFKKQPALVGAGIGAIAAGFGLLGFALMRETKTNISNNKPKYQN